MFNILFFIFAGGLTCDFVNAFENYHGTAKDAIRLLWRGATICMVAWLFSKIS